MRLGSGSDAKAEAVDINVSIHLQKKCLTEKYHIWFFQYESWFWARCKGWSGWRQMWSFTFTLSVSQLLKRPNSPSSGKTGLRPRFPLCKTTILSLHRTITCPFNCIRSQITAGEGGTCPISMTNCMWRYCHDFSMTDCVHLILISPRLMCELGLMSLRLIVFTWFWFSKTGCVRLILIFKDWFCVWIYFSKLRVCAWF